MEDVRRAEENEVIDYDQGSKPHLKGSTLKCLEAFPLFLGCVPNPRNRHSFYRLKKLGLIEAMVNTEGKTLKGYKLTIKGREFLQSLPNSMRG